MVDGHYLVCWDIDPTVSGDKAIYFRLPSEFGRERLRSDSLMLDRVCLSRLGHLLTHVELI